MLATLAALAAAITVQSPAPVQALAADGQRVAYAAGFSAHDCNRVYVWNLRTRAVVKLGRRTHCERTSTGNSISSLALAGNRALWIHYVGGNRRLWSLWTATTTRPQPRLLRSIELDVDDPAPYVLGEGNQSRLGGVLPYAVGDTVHALRLNGSRAFSWKAPARVTALGARGEEVAVAAADGSVTLLGPRGRIVSRLPSGDAPAAVFVTGGDVVAQRGRTVQAYGPDGDRRFAIPAGARVADAQGYTLVYVLRGAVRRVDTLSGTDRLLARGAFVQLEDSWTVTASGRTVSADAS
jgi:hypothetical protein